MRLRRARREQIISLRYENYSLYSRSDKHTILFARVELCGRLQILPIFIKHILETSLEGLFSPISSTQLFFDLLNVVCNINLSI